MHFDYSGIRIFGKPYDISNTRNGTRLVTIKNQDAVTKILDMAPNLISRFTGKKEEDGYTAEKVEHIINQEADKE